MEGGQEIVGERGELVHVFVSLGQVLKGDKE